MLFQCLMKVVQDFLLFLFGQISFTEEFAQFFHGTRTHGGTPSPHTSIIVP